MFEEWCGTCERPMKCHNVGGELYCIGCKQPLGEAPSAPTATA